MCPIYINGSVSVLRVRGGWGGKGVEGLVPFQQAVLSVAWAAPFHSVLVWRLQACLERKPAGLCLSLAAWARALVLV